MYDSQVLTLENALNQIKQVSDEYINAGRITPYFFMVGAGISYPSAPLARDIIEHCKEFASRHGRKNITSALTTQDEYSDLFELAYPNRQQRQNYLKKLIHNKSIPPANIKLAHILSNTVVTNLVVTTNFDDFLSRALNIFGIPHVVSDHPHTVDKINTDSEFIQIVHIHGTYWFYDCCNLQNEIIERAERSLQSNLTMSFFIDSLLYRRIPIIVGYSGWENDVFMQALKRRLQSPLPYNLYWFCYSKESFDVIPYWVKKNSDVKFVLPLETTSIEKSDPDINSSEVLESLNLINKETQRTDILSAETVFEHFINVFNIESPEITRDPIGFFTDTLKKSFMNNNEDNGNNKYFLEDVVARLERVKESKEYNTNAYIEELKELIKKSQYKEVIKRVIEKYRLSSFSLEEHRQLFSIILNAAENISENQEGYNLVITISEDLYLKNNQLSWISQYQCRALMGKGKNLSNEGYYSDAIKCFNLILDDERYKDLNIIKIDALMNKASTHGLLKEHDEEIKLYDFIIITYGNENENRIKAKVSSCLFKKANSYMDLEKNDKALESVDGLLARYLNEEDPSIQEIVVRSMLIKVIIYFQQKMYEESISEVEQILYRFSDDERMNIKRLIGLSLQLKGMLFRAMDRPKEALVVYDELALRFGSVEEPALKEYAASALIEKAQYLDGIGYYEEAIQLYENIIDDYAEIDDLSEKAILSKATSFMNMEKFEEAVALFNKIIEENSKINVTNLEYVATAYLRKGISYARSNRHEIAIETYETLCQNLKKNKKLRAKEIWAMSMLNLAVSFRELNNQERALGCYDDIIGKFKSNKEATIKNYFSVASINKGLILSIQDRKEESIKIFDQVYLKLRSEEDNDLRIYAAKALFYKGKIYHDTNSYEAALSVFDLLENEYKDCEEEKINFYVISAIIEKVSIAVSLKQNLNEQYEILKSLEARIKKVPDEKLHVRYSNQLHVIGYEAYKVNQDFPLAKDAFLRGYNMNNVISGVNLAYMLRRNEITEEGVPPIEILLEGGLKVAEPFAIINKILLDISVNNSDETWIKCNELLNLVKETTGLLEWWKDIASENEAEGHLVIGLICKKWGLPDPDGLHFSTRFDLTNNLGLGVPKWLYN